MQIIDLQQDTEDWHAWRAEGIGGSDAVILADANPDKSPYRLWAEKSGLVDPEDLSKNPWVARGKKLESKARALLVPHGNSGPQCGQMMRYPAIRASFDLLEDGVPTEIKILGPENTAEVKALADLSVPYQMYWYQVQHQLLVSGSQVGKLVFFEEDENMELSVAASFTIPVDRSFLKTHLEKCLGFWSQVVHGIAPHRDPARDRYTPSTEEEINKWAGLAQAYINANRELQDAKDVADQCRKKRDLYRDEFNKLLGIYHTGEANGVSITRSYRSGRVNYKQAFADYFSDLPPSILDEYREEGAISIRVTIK